MLDIPQQNFEVWIHGIEIVVTMHACTHTVTTVDYQTFMHADLCILVKVQILASLVYKM